MNRTQHDLGGCRTKAKKNMEGKMKRGVRDDEQHSAVEHMRNWVRRESRPSNRALPRGMRACL